MIPPRGSVKGVVKVLFLNSKAAAAAAAFGKINRERKYSETGKCYPGVQVHFLSVLNVYVVASLPLLSGHKSRKLNVVQARWEDASLNSAPGQIYAHGKALCRAG